MVNINTTYQAFSEVYDIINHMEYNLYNKIPKQFIEMLERTRDKNYKFKIDYSKNINNQELLHETRVILSIIYRDYLCTIEQKEKLKEKDKEELKKEEELLREKYNPDNLFIKKEDFKEENNVIKQEETALVVVAEKWYEKIFRFIKNIFKK